MVFRKRWVDTTHAYSGAATAGEQTGRITAYSPVSSLCYRETRVK